VSRLVLPETVRSVMRSGWVGPCVIFYVACVLFAHASDVELHPIVWVVVLPGMSVGGAMWARHRVEREQHTPGTLDR
jgi:hypothetical protein